jgi:hypothetical protein
MSDSSSYSTAAGEHLVLGQLLRLGVSAYLAQGPTQKGWDMIFKHGNDLKTVQVKTISWPKEKAVNGSLTSGFDYLVVVLLNKEQTYPRYLVFEAAEVEPFLSKENPERKSKGKRTLTVSSHKIEQNGVLKKYESNWKVML